jgi:hypothetical protein
VNDGVRRPRKKRERIVNVKRDIVAAIIFLTTGLLFYLVQSGRVLDEGLSTFEGCASANAVAIGEADTDTADLLEGLDVRDG